MQASQGFKDSNGPQYLVVDLTATEAYVELSGTDAGGILEILHYTISNCNDIAPYIKFELLNGITTNYTNTTQIVNGIALLNNGAGVTDTYFPTEPLVASVHVPRGIQKFRVSLNTMTNTPVTVTRCVVLLRMTPLLNPYPVPIATRVLEREGLKAHGQ